MRRRPFLVALAAAPSAFALPPRSLTFPRDHGAHPELRTEWWYITGHGTAAGRDFGFQVTFFRTRVDATQAMSSRFAAKQLVFAHAAVTDVQGKKLWHDQRIARQGFGIAEVAANDTQLKLRDWTLARERGDWHTRVAAGEFALDLTFGTAQPVLLQGQAGLSRKGPAQTQASYYYSVPQLLASGRITLRGRPFEIGGLAWLDHEWSDALMHPDAVGWDWVGMNLDDGSALTAFRLRRRDGTPLWDGGSFRNARGELTVFDSGRTSFTPLRRWASAASRANYPVEWQVDTPAGRFMVKAMLDDQELDSRASTGAIYWEGLSELLDAKGQRVGRGYLEMTGYVQPIRF